ncbi:hypothetical protein [Streptomyces sp. NPDC052114]
MLDSIAHLLRWVLALGTPRPRARRHALYLATLGIDVGPDHIHGVRVASR